MNNNTQPMPTDSQKERAASLSRFNWFFVYLPFLLLTIATLVIMGLLLYFNFARPNEPLRTFTGGVANMVIILGTLPLLLLCSLLPLGALFLFIYGRRQGYAPLQTTQHLLWRLENIVGQVQTKVNQTVPKVANPVIAGHARAAYIRSLLNNVARFRQRS
jgi:hypothetical protein